MQINPNPHLPLDLLHMELVGKKSQLYDLIKFNMDVYRSVDTGVGSCYYWIYWRQNGAGWNQQLKQNPDEI